MTGPRKIFVKTFGCQMNVYDSERMTELLGADGFAETATMEEADVVLLNTCHIREKAAEKVYSDLGRIRQVKDARLSAGQATIIAVAGCVAQAEGAEILRRAPFVDLVVGPQSYHRLGDLVARARSEGRQIVETGFPEQDKFATLPKRAPAKAVTAFLTVQEGCDKFCTFCVVPYTRGAEFSRPVADVEAEARRLADHGVREITLLGQNVNAYHGQGPDGRPWSLARLIARLAGIGGIGRIRYTTSHPRDMTDDLIAAHRDQAKLMPYLHLPFQAGADRILAAMNRKHTTADYVAARCARPHRAPGRGVIHRYHRRLSGGDRGRFRRHARGGRARGIRPGLLVQVQRAAGHAGRHAWAIRSPEDVKIDRLHRLQDLLDRQQTAFNSACVGKVVPVLFEREGRHPGQLVGRSPYLQPVHATADTSLLGRIVEVAIAGAGPNSLAGVVKPAEPMTA